ncbi:MAG: ROK family protein [Henriciella sp.]|jgi:glucokinase
MSEYVIVGDVGGTKVRFALARKTDSGIEIDHIEIFRNADFADFSEAVAAYLGKVDVPVEQGLFAMAGPVDKQGSVKLTNRNWPLVRPCELKYRFGLRDVTLVNDFAAMARAIPEMPDSAFEVVLEGTADPDAPVVVTGPGTGFGVSALIRTATNEWRVLTGEGGHAAYAAHTVREAKVAELLSEEYGYVSTEMIVSGAWLQPVHDIISDLHGRPREIVPPAEILKRAEEGDAVAEEVCQLRARSIMGATGDLVLILGGQGGVVLTGGVAERMIKWLRRDGARARFLMRGTHSSFMTDVPVRVLTDGAAPLIGAAALLFDREKA